MTCASPFCKVEQKYFRDLTIVKLDRYIIYIYAYMMLLKAYAFINIGQYIRL